MLVDELKVAIAERLQVVEQALLGLGRRRGRGSRHGRGRAMLLLLVRPRERRVDGHVERAADPAYVVGVLDVRAGEVRRTEARHRLADVLLRAEHGDEHEQQYDRVLAVETVDEVVAAVADAPAERELSEKLEYVEHIALLS